MERSFLIISLPFKIIHIKFIVLFCMHSMMSSLIKPNFSVSFHHSNFSCKGCGCGLNIHAMLFLRRWGEKKDLRQGWKIDLYLLLCSQSWNFLSTSIVETQSFKDYSNATVITLLHVWKAALIWVFVIQLIPVLVRTSVMAACLPSLSVA